MGLICKKELFTDRMNLLNAKHGILRIVLLPLCPRYIPELKTNRKLHELQRKNLCEVTKSFR